MVSLCMFLLMEENNCIHTITQNFSCSFFSKILFKPCLRSKKRLFRRKTKTQILLWLLHRQPLDSIQLPLASFTDWYKATPRCSRIGQYPDLKSLRRQWSPGVVFKLETVEKLLITDHADCWTRNQLNWFGGHRASKRKHSPLVYPQTYSTFSCIKVCFFLIPVIGTNGNNNYIITPWGLNRLIGIGLLQTRQAWATQAAIFPHFLLCWFKIHQRHHRNLT